MQIKFGTDGWRAQIADGFTYANLEIVTQALADYLKRENPNGRNSVLVGYDRRFASDHFAQRVAEVLAGNEIHVDLYNHDVPTPLVSFEVKRRRLDGGVVITASHNPPEFNGFKFKAPYGGAATPAWRSSRPRSSTSSSSSSESSWFWKVKIELANAPYGSLFPVNPMVGSWASAYASLPSNV